MAGSNRKKKRTKKVSKGIHGAGGKVDLSEVQKALLGGGVLSRLRGVEMGRALPWSGASPIVRSPWDPDQAQLNREAGLTGE